MAKQITRQAIPGERRADVPDAETSRRLVMLKPYVRQSGDEWREPWFLKKRMLLDYLVVYIAEGTGLFSVGDTSFDVRANDLIWIPPNTTHEMRGYAPRMHCLFMHFDLCYDAGRSHWDAYIPGGTLDLTAFKSRMHPPVPDQVIGSWCGKLAISNHAAIRSILEEICWRHASAPSGAALSLSGQVLSLVEAIVADTTQARERGESHSSEMQEAVSKIMEQADRELDVSRLALSVHMSPSHFRKLFRSSYGISARTMHRQARIRKACSLLIYHDLSVSKVAEAIGFSGIHNFSRAFKEMTGMAPGEYKRSGKLG